MATPPAYPATVVTSSATARAGITHTAVAGVDEVTLPVIVASGAASGQANAGDIVYLAANEQAWGIVVDANTSQPFDAVAPLGSAFYVASATLIWKRVGTGVPVTHVNVPPGTGAGPVAFGSGNVPAAISTPGAPTGWVPVILPSGTIGFCPYWT
jgi:hypothetical protein